MRQHLGWLALLALVAGCGEDGHVRESDSLVGDAIDPGAEHRGLVGHVAEVAPWSVGTWIEQSGFVVHEWGTFTSVQSSVGETMVGMQRVDEPLPQFVYSWSNGPFKGLAAAPVGVTQRLETPVVYFYTPAPLDVSVTVGFPEGLVSEYYPNVTTLWPEPTLEAVPIRDGLAHWQVRIQPGVVEVPWVDPDDIWAPSRRVSQAASVLTDTESERFIFYRGLGTFDMPVRIQHASLERIVVSNESDTDIPAVFLIRVHEGGAGIEALGALPGGGWIDEVPSPKELDLDEYVLGAQALVAEALEQTGLYPDEARAMVETWERSYFRTPGLRLLYVAPREWTDALLPMTIEPAPDQLVRTLVGRIEVLTEDEELALADRVEALVPLVAADLGEAWSFVEELGRLAEPKLRRVYDLLETDAARDLCGMLIEQVRVTP